MIAAIFRAWLPQAWSFPRPFLSLMQVIQRWVQVQQRLEKSYRIVSTASVDALWQTINNLADVSWHPLLTSTNAPLGLSPKPGLIYRAFTRLFPLPVSVFVERVLPQELISVRVLPMPGLEERITYELKSTLRGTQISYSITLQGWLSPLAWSVMRPYAAKVATALAEAAEQPTSLQGPGSRFQAW
ncbi:polyketide cyclase/dehydrase and lipid transport protein [Leptolyngbya sp. BL0902]|uniref:SRPBCC family protein n=1 Tax=Leptolyngbya sp. BL0902 TaxID=1115757 RepID=UPI001935D354|nr:SRPBCC family protein [Leptolyngbya sp. BL0902]QQE64575.1 polyketide cyclase/dehydrase and lipid transport protein [Leptolyngbya sp. BL0902]